MEMISIYPLVNIQIAIETGHRNSWFTHRKGWIFPCYVNVYQRVNHINTSKTRSGISLPTLAAGRSKARWLHQVNDWNDSRGATWPCHRTSSTWLRLLDVLSWEKWWKSDGEPILWTEDLKIFFCGCFLISWWKFGRTSCFLKIST